jgi:hypothetical protein
MKRDELQGIDELQREFRRVGVTPEAFRELERQNFPTSPPSPPADSLSMALDIPGTIAVLRSLPDRAGEAAFLDAFKAAFLTDRRPKRGGGTVGA